MPTEKQKDTAIFVCQLLSLFLQPILLFRYHPLQKYIFLIAPERGKLRNYHL
ncbi:DUF6888 family protein [Tolypothrix sp. VBCCA 56010]|uniref:DUF6888 family protein n=1 Tax=Tolypothrix sp. VBCCA 56010 TaxID=3137731 RepID=UPI003D7E0AA7